MTTIEAFEKRLKEAEEKLDKLLQQHIRAGVATRGDLENLIEEVREKITYYEENLTRAQEQQKVTQGPFYCYVFTNTLPEIAPNYQEQERLDWLKKRYHQHQLEDWQPFVRKYEPITIKDILSPYQKKYPLKVIYWKSKAQHYLELDKNFNQTFAILDWLALKASNKRGFFRYDSQEAKYVAPHCSTTYALFTKKIEENKEEFDALPKAQQPLQHLNMDLFNSSDIHQMKTAIQYFLNELSGNIHHQSTDNSPIRDLF